jgi:hypothetical protein
MRMNNLVSSSNPYNTVHDDPGTLPNQFDFHSFGLKLGAYGAHLDLAQVVVLRSRLASEVHDPHKHIRAEFNGHPTR